MFVESHRRPLGIVALSSCVVLLLAYAQLSRELAVGLAEFGYQPMSNGVLPWSANRGFTWEQLFDHVYRLILLGPAAVLASIGAYCLLPDRFVRRVVAERWANVSAAVCLSLTAFVMLAVLRGRAISDDENVYRMEGSFLLDGRLVGRDVGYFPMEDFTVRGPHGYTGKYLPGEPLLQAIFTRIDRPALAHLPLLALALFAWSRTLRRTAGRDVAAWSTFFLALSPMLVMTSATGLTQTTALTCVVLAGLGHAWAEGERPRAGALLAGVALGFCAMTRPQAALPAGIVIGLALLRTLHRRRDVAAAALFVLSLAVFAALIGAYDLAVTGSALELPWFLQPDPEHYGFGRVRKYTRFEHTIVTALENQVVTAVRFNGWWLGWPAGLAVVVVWWKLARHSRGIGLWFAVGAAVVVFEAGYYGTGVSDTGPLYHFLLLLPASLMAGQAMAVALARWPRAAVSTLVAHVLVGTASFLVVQTARISRLVTFIHRDSDAALARIDGRAILFFERWGSESLSIGWVNDFPRRYRSDADRVVTYPRPPGERLATVLAHFPDRACWYYHVDPSTERGQSMRCKDAGEFLHRPMEDASRHPWLWVQPTAYKKTSFDPWADTRADRLSPHVPKLPPCSLLDDLRAAGEYIDDPSCYLDWVPSAGGEARRASAAMPRSTTVDASP